MAVHSMMTMAEVLKRNGFDKLVSYNPVEKKKLSREVHLQELALVARYLANAISWYLPEINAEKSEGDSENTSGTAIA